jgi:hypothetical protein
VLIWEELAGFSDIVEKTAAGTSLLALLPMSVNVNHAAAAADARMQTRR